MARDRRSETSGERSEEERERARAERERRRLAKTDADQPAPPVEDRAAPPLPPPLVEPPVAQEITPNGLIASDPLPLEPDSEQPEALEPNPENPEKPEALELQPEQPETLEPERREVAEQTPPRYPLPLLSSTSARTGRKAGPRKQRGSLPKAHRPHVHRPHLHRAHSSPIRTGAARVGAVLALLVVLAAIAAGVVLLTRHGQRPKPPPVPATVKVVIPEGYTRPQIAALAHADGLHGSYLTASKKSTELSPAHYGAPAGTPSLEGFLFPATYEMYAGGQASQLVSEQLAAFGENFGGGEVHRAKVLGVTPYELLIVASIIEREVAIPHDRPLVAAVIYNRLRLNMTLGVDSTLRYALHDFTHPLTETELNSNSPYNTRIHKGLPPTPISNPGAAAIAAAGHPAKVSYLYYVAGADGCGEQVFSTSYSQFEKNAAAYHEALSKNGGNVPRCKKG